MSSTAIVRTKMVDTSVLLEALRELGFKYLGGGSGAPLGRQKLRLYKGEYDVDILLPDLAFGFRRDKPDQPYTLICDSDNQQVSNKILQMYSVVKVEQEALKRRLKVRREVQGSNIVVVAVA